MAVTPKKRVRHSKTFRWKFFLGVTLLVFLIGLTGLFLWPGFWEKGSKSSAKAIPPRPAVKPRLIQGKDPQPANGGATAETTSSSHKEESRILFEEHFSHKEPPPPLLPPVGKPSPTKPPKGGPVAAVAVVIDDLGFNASLSRSIAKLPADITLAILPSGPFARQVVEIGQRTGKEIILHQPMEPMEYPKVDPGPHALFSGMSDGEIQAIVDANLNRFPEAVGLNNHMGSRATTHVAAMASVMKTLQRRGLFFVDSRTSQRSVAYDQALAAGIPAARRQVFIDNQQRVEAILGQLRLLEQAGRSRGEAVGIGHPYPETLQALEIWLAGLDKRRIRVVKVSHFLTSQKR